MKIWSIAAIAVTMAGYVGAAEEVSTKPATSAAEAEQEAKPLGSHVDAFGKVTSTHSCPMVGNGAPHMLVKLETEQGDTEIVDLGSAEDLKTSGIEPKEGKQLWVEGRVGKINDKFLIFAEHISESKMVDIARTDKLVEESIKHSDAKKDNGSATTAVNPTTEAAPPGAAKMETVAADAQMSSVDGTIVHTRRIAIEGEAEEHVLAKLDTHRGIAVVDLGIYSSIPEAVKICDGNRLFVTGAVGQLNEKPIIISKSVSNTGTETNTPITK